MNVGSSVHATYCHLHLLYFNLTLGPAFFFSCNMDNFISTSYKPYRLLLGGCSELMSVEIFSLN